MSQALTNSHVYCQILGGSISPSLCDEEQGQKGCKGCNAHTRRCEKCKTNQSENPQSGLCADCLGKAVKAGFCEACRKRPASGKYCTACYQEKMRSGELEPQEKGTRPKSVEISIEAIMDKAETLVHDGFVPGAKKKVGTPEIIEEQPPLQQTDSGLPVRIVDHVARHYDLTKEDILAHRRHATLVFPRFVCMFLLRESGLSFLVIGAFLSRDHTSIMHGCRVIKDQIERDEKLRNDLNLLRKTIGMSEPSVPASSLEFVPPAPKTVEPQILVHKHEALAYNANVDSESIVKHVSRYFDVAAEDLVSRRKGESMGLPRQVLAYFLFEAGYTQDSIALHLARSEGAIYSSVRRFVRSVLTRPEVQSMVTTLRDLIGNNNSQAKEVIISAEAPQDKTEETQARPAIRVGGKPGRKPKLGKPGFSPETAVAAVMAHYNLPRGAFFSGGKREHAGQRRLLMALLKQAGDMGASAIATFLKKTSQSVVLAIRIFMEEIAHNKDLANTFETLRERLLKKDSQPEAPKVAERVTQTSTVQPPPKVILRKQEKIEKVDVPQVEQQPAENIPPVQLEKYQRAVARHYGVNAEWLTTPEKVDVSLPKQVFVYLLRKQGMPFIQIAQSLGCKPQAVFMAAQAVEKRLAKSPTIQQSLKAIQEIAANKPLATEDAEETKEDTNEAELDVQMVTPPVPGEPQPPEVIPAAEEVPQTQEHNAQSDVDAQRRQELITECQRLAEEIENERRLRAIAEAKIAHYQKKLRTPEIQREWNRLHHVLVTNNEELKSVEAEIAEMQELFGDLLPPGPEAAKAEEERLQAMKKAIQESDHYRNWLYKVNELSSLRALNALRPRLEDSRNPVQNPTSASVLGFEIDRHDWVWLLAEICAEYITHANRTVGFVAHFAEAIPLPSALLATYVQDDRIILLTGKRSLKEKLSKHLIVCDSALEAKELGYHLEMRDFTDGLLSGVLRL